MENMWSLFVHDCSADEDDAQTVVSHKSIAINSMGFLLVFDAHILYEQMAIEQHCLIHLWALNLFT